MEMLRSGVRPGGGRWISLGVLRLLILSVLQVAETSAGWLKPQSLVFLEGGRWVQGLGGARGHSAVSGLGFSLYQPHPLLCELDSLPLTGSGPGSEVGNKT